MTLLSLDGYGCGLGSGFGDGDVCFGSFGDGGGFGGSGYGSGYGGCEDIPPEEVA